MKLYTNQMGGGGEGRKIKKYNVKKKKERTYMPGILLEARDTREQ